MFPFYLTASSFVSYSLLLISPWGSSAALVWYLIASFHLVYRQCPRLPGVSILCSKSMIASRWVGVPYLALETRKMEWNSILKLLLIILLVDICKA